METRPVCIPKEKAYDLATSFYRLIEHEVISGCAYLGEHDAEVLRSYYHNLIHHPRRIPYYRHNWVRRITPIVMEVLASNGDLDILDAGCGRGTEAIFLASLREGVTVRGIDCHWPGLRTAQRRKAHYEQLLNRQLRVSFHNGDVFSIPADQTFDLVWLMESVSHIHPAETFLGRLPHLLREGGLVGISDSNRLNPFMLLVVLRLRRKGIYFSEVPLQETGQMVKMAEERLFTPGAVERKLVSVGLRIKVRILGGFFPPIVGALPAIAARLNRLESICQKSPGLASLAGIYTMIAQKPGRGSVGVRDCRQD
jgi:2-polyprenyl-3-methyl-5-hydroxy-6-metoxy-1,4-benzoquinol methylase